MNSMERLIALSQQAIDSGKVSDNWEKDFLNSVISQSRSGSLSIKQKNRIYKILKKNGCYKDYL